MFEHLALDQATVRSRSEDGHLHVGQSNISKATVNPYWGREIPGYDELGLDPDKKYLLWRHPGELAKGAKTFNNLPIMADHVPISADKHRPDLVIGSTGTDAQFADPYLRNSLVFWTKPAIDAIESNEQKELSAAYHYVPVMTPGVTPDGQRYDGIMTQLRGNHVALVEDGRAGKDVVVGDSAFDPTAASGIARSTQMAKLAPAGLVARSALFTYLSPRLAADQSIDLNSLVAGITSKNYAARRGALKDKVTAAARGKLAMDADLRDLANLLDALSPDAESADQLTTAPSAGPPMGAVGGGAAPPMDAEPHDTLAKIKAFLEEQGVSPEIINNLDAFAASAGQPPNGAGGNGPAPPPPPPGPGDRRTAGDQGPANAGMFAKEKTGADEGMETRGEEGEGEPSELSIDQEEACDEDETEEERKKREAEDEVIPNKQDDVDGVVTKSAMDRAIKIAQDRAIRNQRAVRDAERFVRPWVGDLAMDAMHPADIYRTALKSLGVRGADTMHNDALRPVLEAQPRPSRTTGRVGVPRDMAADAKPQQSFLERFPEVKGVRLQ
jgi:hypothetical protein